IKNDKEKALQNLDRHKRSYEPLEKGISNDKAKIKNIERSLQNVVQEKSKRFRFVNDIQDNIEYADQKFKYNIQECDSKIQAEEQRRNEVKAVLQQIDKLKNDIRNINKDSDIAIREEIENLSHQFTKKLNVKNQLRSEKEVHQNELEAVHQNIQVHETNIQKIQDVAKQRLQLLQHRNRDAYEAVLWLRENKQRFHYRIYEPMILEINIPNPSHAKYVESIIPRRDLFAFTCEDKRDMNELIRILRGEKKLKINAVHSGSEHPPLSSFRPNIDIQQLRHLGFYSYLSDMFNAPELIKSYLCRMYRLHNIPVGNNSTFNNSEKVPDGIRCFFSENHNFSVNKSKYSGHKSSRIAELFPPNLLAISLNTQHLQELQSSLQKLVESKATKMASLEGIQIKIHRIEHELETLRSKRKELNEHLDTQKTIEARLKAKQSQLEQLERGKIDPEAEKIKCCEENKKLIFCVAEQKAALLEQLKLYDQISVENEIIQQELEILKEVVHKKENESHELLQKFEDAKRILSDVDQRIKHYKTEATHLYEEAKVATDGITPREVRFTTFKEAFSYLPDTEEELAREIQKYQAQADCLGDSDETILTEFENQKSHIASLKQSVKDKEEECRKIKEEMDSVRESWLEPLETLVDQINRKYGDCFARLQCAGEVSLVHGDNE
ncbi:hypothetical protein L9F63_007482, partial [Diploptera punctata]